METKTVQSSINSTNSDLSSRKKSERPDQSKKAKPITKEQPSVVVKPDEPKLEEPVVDIVGSGAEKKKEVSLGTMFAQIESKCKKEKRVINSEEVKKLDQRFQQDFPDCPFAVSTWIYGNLNKKYKESFVHFVDKRVPGGLVKIKKSQPTVKQILKQLSKTLNAEILADQNQLNELKILYSNDSLILLGTEWSSKISQ